ncbi:MAG TPA: alanine--tRNA ligase-related protein, partial [Chitinophagaceae bacterium]|nr:alanine--tRNA ligase-related protein [Chitinophagaceae bacterium]
MQRIGSKEIREKFLHFFRDNDHQLIQGSSIIPKNDPTLLFINSGMAPMKNYFLGTQQPPYPRMANVQPCIRTNDIEDVGDRHHLTFFEMMGSWSIGDYYKEKAIALAYDLLVNYFKFPPERLYATVYRGNESLGISPDEESIRCWQKVGMPADHIVPLGEDNFWGPAGDTGPCGPCTEVFFDTGEEFGPKYHPGGHFDDKGRYIEIWNAGVFMELNKDKEGKFSPLPMKSVDTGSGIERMYLALNRCESVYDVDTIKPIIDIVSNILNSPELDIRDHRVVTDHMRTASILLGEGIVPDKEGKGYIARRLIRKSIAIAMRAGKSPFVLKEVVEEVIRQMAVWYPYLSSNRMQILNVLEQETKDFVPVVELGLEMLNDRISRMSDKLISGEFVFEL